MPKKDWAARASLYVKPSLGSVTALRKELKMRGYVTRKDGEVTMKFSWKGLGLAVAGGVVGYMLKLVGVVEFLSNIGK